MPWTTQTTMMKRNNRPIKSLAELRMAKKALKFKIDAADQQAKEGLILSSVNKFFGSVESNSHVHSSKLGAGVHSALGFLSNTVEKTFKLSNRSSSIVSIGIAIAAPIIAKKLQDYLDKKL